MNDSDFLKMILREAELHGGRVVVKLLPNGVISLAPAAEQALPATKGVKLPEVVRGDTVCHKFDPSKVLGTVVSTNDKLGIAYVALGDDKDNTMPYYLDSLAVVSEQSETTPEQASKEQEEEKFLEELLSLEERVTNLERAMSNLETVDKLLSDRLEQLLTRRTIKRTV